MSNPECARPAMMERSTSLLTADGSGVNESSAWAAGWDLDVREVLERATELTLVDWLELADLLSGHF